MVITVIIIIMTMTITLVTITIIQITDLTKYHTNITQISIIIITEENSIKYYKD